MTISKQNIKDISRRGAYILFILLYMCGNKTYGQTDKDLPIIEDFETDSVWPWKPWENRGNRISMKTREAVHSGKFALNSQSNGYAIRMDKQIGLPGEAISCWVRFQNYGGAYCGFGINASSERGYYLCVDPATKTLHFSKSPDYTYPLLKVVSQTYKLNVWYRVEVTFNTKTNVSGKLYASDGTTLLKSVTVDIPDLAPGGIAFRGTSLYVDDIRGGTRSKQAIADTPFALKLGTPLILKNIVFETNKSNLLEQSFVELDKLVAYLKRNPTFNMDIVGHTDTIGKEDDNKNLSEARAKAVADYLIKHTINKNRISCRGLGSSSPIATNATEEGRQKNRRVECVISDK